MSGTAAGLLVRGGRVLFGLRSADRRHYPACWDAPGGHLEPGEGWEDALRRELREELGVEATACAFLEEVAFAEDGLAVPCRVYAVTAWTGEPRNEGGEHDELRWFAPDELARAERLASRAYPALARRAVLAALDAGA